MTSFQAKYFEDVYTGCFQWIGALRKGGYGCFGFGGKIETAHRVAWMLKFGLIPKGFEVCHKCDNPACVNPEHLFLGTRQDNMDDAVSKNRVPRGETHGRHVLNKQEVISIRESGGSYMELAKQFNVAKNTIGRVVRGETWKHISSDGLVNPSKSEASDRCNPIALKSSTLSK